MPKITDYPVATTIAALDLIDVSAYNGGVPESRSLDYSVLLSTLNDDLDTIYSNDGSLSGARTVTLSSVNTLKFTGGSTTFVGEDSTSANFSLKALDITETFGLEIDNEGRIILESTQATLSNIESNGQILQMFTDAAAYVGFNANRDGGEIALRAKGSEQRIDTTHDFYIGFGWDGNAPSSEGTDAFKLDSNGDMSFRTPDAAPTDTNIINQLAVTGGVSFYLDETANELKVRVRYKDSTTYKTGTVALV
jgi:hypothetical protein